MIPFDSGDDLGRYLHVLLEECMAVSGSWRLAVAVSSAVEPRAQSGCAVDW